MAVLIFGKEYLDRQIAMVSPYIPKEHDSAFIATTDEQGIQAILLVKRDIKKGTLTAAAVLRHEWTGDNQAAASLMYSWKKE